MEKGNQARLSGPTEGVWANSIKHAPKSRMQAWTMQGQRPKQGQSGLGFLVLGQRAELHRWENLNAYIFG